MSIHPCRFVHHAAGSLKAPRARRLPYTPKTMHACSAELKGYEFSYFLFSETPRRSVCTVQSLSDLFRL